VGAQRRLAHGGPLGHLADGGHEIADANDTQGPGPEAGTRVGPRRLAEERVDVDAAQGRSPVSFCASSSLSTAQSRTDSRA